MSGPTVVKYVKFVLSVERYIGKPVSLVELSNQLIVAEEVVGFSNGVAALVGGFGDGPAPVVNVQTVPIVVPCAFDASTRHQYCVNGNRFTDTVYVVPV